MPAPSLTTVTGTVYDAHGQPAAGRSLYLKHVLLNGVLQPTGPVMTANIDRPIGGDATVRYVEEFISNASGVITFTVPQLSTVYLEGNVSGYNNGEVALSIPATATATLESLTPATFPIDVTTFTFLSLVDTPDDFTGDALKVVRVNAAGTALEFAAPVVVDNETVQDALSAFFPDVAPFDWTYDDAGDRVTLAILDATASARGLMSTAYAARLDQLEVGDAPTFAGLTLTGPLLAPNGTLAAPGQSYANFTSSGFYMSAQGIHASVGGGYHGRFASSGLVVPGIFGLEPSVDSGADVALARRALGVARISNGTTGSGQLLIGSSTDTIAAQLHTLSNAIGVIPLIAEGPAGQTANLFEARVNGVAKVLVTALGGLETNSTTILNQDGFRITSGFHTALWNGGRLQWSSTVASGGAPDAALTRAAAKLIGITDASTGGGGFEFTEVADFAAGAANKARLYARDNGSGKTQLVVIFPTGAVQVIATEP